MKNNVTSSNVLDMCRYTPDRFMLYNISIVYELASDALAFAVAETSELDDYLPQSMSNELLQLT